MNQPICEKCGAVGYKKKNRVLLRPVRLPAVNTKNISIPQQIIYRKLCHNCRDNPLTEQKQNSSYLETFK
jgi:hypothetical protein